MNIIDLKAHEFMWSGEGTEFPRTNPVGYNRIPGSRPGEEIWIYHHGTDQQPMWRYMVCDASGHFRSCRYFASKEDALDHALQDAIPKTRLVTLRHMDEHIIDNIDETLFLQEFKAGWCFYGEGSFSGWKHYGPYPSLDAAYWAAMELITKERES